MYMKNILNVLTTRHSSRTSWFLKPKGSGSTYFFQTSSPSPQHQHRHNFHHHHHHHHHHRQSVFDHIRKSFGTKMANRIFQEQPFDYYLVLDFEATCDFKEANKRIHPKEIIEFPVLKVNGRSFEIEAVFHTYVQPKVHPQLTSFCSQLTGIVQEMVDGKPFIDEVLKDFHKWLVEQELLNSKKRFTFVTCGDWDLNIMLPQQCNYCKIPIPNYFGQWVNIKRTFADHTGTYVRGLTEILGKLKIPHQGRLHSGIDDCKNIAAISAELARLGAVIHVNGQWSQQSAGL